MPSAPRCVARVGPYLSGKTSLLEAMLFASGTTSRHGSVRDGNSVGDHAAEARARQMSTEINVANATFLGDPWTILDCPGSVELLYEAQQAMLVADIVVVVCEPEVERAITVSALLHFLARHNIPHMLFINKMDAANARLEQLLEDRQPSRADIYKHRAADVQKGLIVPVFVGAAGQDHGVRRLWKALRHEAPEPSVTAARIGIDAAGEPLAQVFK